MIGRLGHSSLTPRCRMKPLLGVLFLFVLPSLLSTVSSAPSASAVVTHPDEANAQNLLLECKNSDYRTYIRCLKRQKRHHTEDSHCFEGCLKKCTDIEDHAECEKKCAHCSKKTKHRHQIITEYETECTSGDCSKTDDSSKGLGTTNITTNIDINNIINTNAFHNKTGSCCPKCQPPVPCPPGVPPGVPPGFPPGFPPGLPPGFPSGYPPGFPGLYPGSLTLVPQLTLGLGLGFSGGNPCVWPYDKWPCTQHTPPIDCSSCRNPFLSFKCDVSCYTMQQRTAQQHSTETPCRSPQCVGGTW